MAALSHNSDALNILHPPPASSDWRKLFPRQKTWQGKDGTVQLLQEFPCIQATGCFVKYRQRKRVHRKGIRRSSFAVSAVMDINYLPSVGFIHSQSCVVPEDVEVAVKNWRICTYLGSGDKAINKLADCLTLPSAQAIESGGIVIVGRLGL